MSNFQHFPAPQQQSLVSVVKRSPASRWKSFDIITIVVASCGGLVMAGIIVLGLLSSPVGTVLAIMLAVIPLALLYCFYRWLDSYEPEPFRLLALAFIWGSCGSTGISLVVNTIAGSLTTMEVAVAVVAPVVEESAKGIFLVGLLWMRRGDMDGIVDGIVYAGIVAAGFAFTENILYFTNAWIGVGLEGENQISGPAGLSATFIMRGVISPFAHPLFTTCIGIGVGIAVLSKSKSVMLLAPFIGWVSAVGLHALWNGTAVAGDGGLFLALFGVFQLPLFLSFLGYCFWERRKLSRQLQGALEDAARRGLVPLGDIHWIVNENSRRAALAYALHRGGPQARQTTQEYQKKVIHLGFLHFKVLNHTAPEDYKYRGQDLIGDIRRLRPYVPVQVR